MLFEESVLALHCIPDFIWTKEEEKEQMHTYFGDMARVYHFYYIFEYIRLVGVMSMSLLFFFDSTKIRLLYKNLDVINCAKTFGS